MEVRTKFSTSLPPSLARDLHRRCLAEERSRSQVIQDALRQHLYHRGEETTKPAAVPPLSDPTGLMQRTSSSGASVRGSRPTESELGPSGDTRPKALLESRLVKHVMPDSSPTEIAEASKRWFAFLSTLAEIVDDRRAAQRQRKGYNQNVLSSSSTLDARMPPRPDQPNTVERELDEAVERVLASASRKKLVVAGPGAGKTTLFRKLLDQADGDVEQRLVLTFINNLKSDLDRSLGEISRVFTLHGYCQHLLHQHRELRNGLMPNFVCYPGLVSFIKKDWEWLQGSQAPQFVELMRDLRCAPEQSVFYAGRANYYDAVDFDDSVYRIYENLVADPSATPAYELVLIDEFQDFNRMEAAVIDMLAEQSPIVIAGDDDQALYSQLRGASWDHIRARYESGHYELFELPFCMRCPEVIVGAVNDIIGRARRDRKLQGRIDKPYRYFEPVKGEDSRRYPRIELVETTVQRANANYFGRYIEQCVRAISEEETCLATERHEPVALIIGSNPYRRQVEEHLIAVGLVARSEETRLSERERGYEILVRNAESNLGWRIILATDTEAVAREAIRAAAEQDVPLASVLAAEYRTQVLREAHAWSAEHPSEDHPIDEIEDVPSVKVTSFEGAKGLSAQYVFVIGLHSEEIPRNAAAVQDLEICRFLVAITRTKKKCSILHTRRFGNTFKRRSEFLSWIGRERFEQKVVNAAYFS